jgi:hypothetical protein
MEPEKQRQLDPAALEQVVPADVSLEERILMAAMCPDLKKLPRVRRAGQVRLLPDGRRIQVMHNGLRVLANGCYGDWMARLIELCKGYHEHQEELVFHTVMSGCRQSYDD